MSAYAVCAASSTEITCRCAPSFVSPADPETREKGRSAFVRSAVSSYLDAKRSRDVDTAIREAYGGANDDMQAEVTGLMDAQAWPRD